MINVCAFEKIEQNDTKGKENGNISHQCAYLTLVDMTRGDKKKGKKKSLTSQIKKKKKRGFKEKCS